MPWLGNLWKGAPWLIAESEWENLKFGWRLLTHGDRATTPVKDSLPYPRRKKTVRKKMPYNKGYIRSSHYKRGAPRHLNYPKTVQQLTPEYYRCCLGQKYRHQLDGDGTNWIHGVKLNLNDWSKEIAPGAVSGLQTGTQGEFTDQDAAATADESLLPVGWSEIARRYQEYRVRGVKVNIIWRSDFNGSDTTAHDNNLVVGFQIDGVDQVTPLVLQYDTTNNRAGYVSLVSSTRQYEYIDALRTIPNGAIKFLSANTTRNTYTNQSFYLDYRKIILYNGHDSDEWDNCWASTGNANPDASTPFAPVKANPSAPAVPLYLRCFVANENLFIDTSGQDLAHCIVSVNFDVEFRGAYHAPLTRTKE
jgi:hypothetical protein